MLGVDGRPPGTGLVGVGGPPREAGLAGLDGHPSEVGLAGLALQVVSLLALGTAGVRERVLAAGPGSLATSAVLLVVGGLLSGAGRVAVRGGEELRRPDV